MPTWPTSSLTQDLQAEIVAPGATCPPWMPPRPPWGSAGADLQVHPVPDRGGRCVLVVACGNARVDVQRVEALTGIVGLKLAKPDVVLAMTGYPAGGTPPMGHRERFR